MISIKLINLEKPSRSGSNVTIAAFVPMPQGMPASSEVETGLHAFVDIPLDSRMWLQGAAQIDYMTNLLALLIGTLTVSSDLPGAMPSLKLQSPGSAM